MKYDFPGIILQDKLYSIEDLVFFCEKQLTNTELPEWELSIYKFIIDFFDEKDYVIQKSSGSTGKPKKFHLSKEAMIESAKSTIKILGLKWTDKALLCLPIDYIAGKMMIVRSLVAGLNLFWEEPSSMPLLSKYGRIDFCAMVPLQVYNSFSNYEFFKNIKNLIIGGAELRSEVLAMFRDFPNNTYETYGMAETCSHIALRKISGKDPDEYFKAMPGVSISVDERSCLVVEASYLSGKVVTNDMVELISKDEFVWRGRIDNLINSGGKKIKPEELEATIAKLIDSECAIIGMPDPVLGQKIVLVAESDSGQDKEAIILLLKEQLHEHQVPKEIILVEELPRTTSLKIDRNKLIELVS